jgi:hypothetical protein
MLKSWETCTSDTVLRPDMFRPISAARAGRLPYDYAGQGRNIIYSASQTLLRVLLFFSNGTALGHACGKYQNAEMTVVRHRAEGRKNDAWDLRHVTRTREGSTRAETSLRSTFSRALRSKCRLRAFEAASDVLVDHPKGHMPIS